MIASLVFVACAGERGSDSTSTTGAVRTTTTTTLPPTTTISTTTTTISTTTTTSVPPTTTPPPLCAGLPSATTPRLDAPTVTWAFGDFDGSGDLSDRLIAYLSGGTWRIQMLLDYGFATELDVQGPAAVHGSVSFAGAAEHVGIAQVLQGASIDVFAFFYLDGCEIVQAGRDERDAAFFAVGGSVNDLSGLRCEANGIVVTSAIHTAEPDTYEYTTEQIDWSPGLGRFVTVDTSSMLLTSPQDDATILAADDLDCPPPS